MDITKPSQLITLFGEFSSFKKEFTSDDELKVFLNKFNQFLNEDWLDWSFIENWFPNYYHADIIALNNDLACYAHDEWKDIPFETEQRWAENIEKTFGIGKASKEFKISEASDILNRFDRELYAEALENYMKVNHVWPNGPVS